MKTKKERIYKNVPQECNMPDISDLDAPLKNRLIVVLVGFSDKGLTQKGGIYRKIFIRLIDKAISEYTKSREALVGVVKKIKDEDFNSLLGFTFVFNDHMENCINAVKRLINLQERLKSEIKKPFLFVVTLALSPFLVIGNAILSLSSYVYVNFGLVPTVNEGGTKIINTICFQTENIEKTIPDGRI